MPATLHEQLIARFHDGTATVGIIGLGYVGLPLAVAFAEAGITVVAVEIAAEKVAALRAGRSYVEDVSDDAVARQVAAGRLRATTDPMALAAADAISICVPTPLRKTKDPDISFILAAAQTVARVGPRGKLVVLESTTYPGSTDEIILPALKDNGLTVGEDFFLAFSPERIDPGRSDWTLTNTPKVIGGVTEACRAAAIALYGNVVETLIPVSSTAAAEMVKLLENTFRAVNIGLVNEVALMCDKLGLDVWEVVEAAATKPYGFMKFTPGPGLGGHCIPVDPHYLSWKLRTLNYTARFIELASEINGTMPEYVVGKVADALNDDAKAVRGSRVLVLGVAYKPNVSDVRESPALDIMHLLEEKGARVTYHDPHVPDLAGERLPHRSVVLSADTLAAADCVVIVTDHRAFDWAFVDRHTRLIVDTRHALPAAQHARVVSL